MLSVRTLCSVQLLGEASGECSLSIGALVKNCCALPSLDRVKMRAPLPLARVKVLVRCTKGSAQLSK